MSPALYLALIGMMIAVGTLAAARRGRTIGWPAAAVATLVLGGLGIYGGHPVLVRLAGIAATLGLIVPALAFSAARRAAGRGDYGRAARISAIIAAVRRDRPMNRWRDLWAAADAWHRGDPAPARGLRARLAAADDAQAASVREALAVLTRDWPRAQFARAVDVQARALCELGEVDRGVETTGRALSARLSWNSLRRVRLLWLTPLAFAGRVEAVAALCRLVGLSPPLAALWRATALGAAGRPEEAHAALDAAEGALRFPALRSALAARRAHLPGPRPIGAGAADVLAVIEREVRAGLNLKARPWWRDVAVLAILGALCVGFLLQAYGGGTMNGRAAWRLGALLGGRWPQEPLRLLAYGFLHFGLLHLLVNALAIAVLAPMVSAAIGRLGLCLVYLGAVLGGGVGIALFGSQGLTVGASGGAMGLLGATLVILWRHPGLRGTLTGNAGARFALGVMVVQSAFDLAVAEISFVGHASGALSGAMGALLWISLARGRSLR